MNICIPASISNTQYYLNQAYAKYVLNCGLNPIIVPPGSSMQGILDVCHGLLLPGGLDVDPVYYGEDNISSYKVDPEKDSFERTLLYAFINSGKPVFGICRGLQLIMCEWLSLNPKVNEFMYLTQHINDHDQIGKLSVERNIRTHKVDFLSGILYGNGVEAGDLSRMFVNSMHHQAVYVNPPKANLVAFGRLVVCATSRRGLGSKERGYVAEAVRIRWNNSKVLAVQWHPEELDDRELLSNFFNGQDTELQNGFATQPDGE